MAVQTSFPYSKLHLLSLLRHIQAPSTLPASPEGTFTQPLGQAEAIVAHRCPGLTAPSECCPSPGSLPCSGSFCPAQAPSAHIPTAGLRGQSSSSLCPTQQPHVPQCHPLPWPPLFLCPSPPRAAQPQSLWLGQAGSSKIFCHFHPQSSSVLRSARLKR